MKRSDLRRKKPLPRKRATPRRRAPERVQHVRTKPKAGSKPTAEQERFHHSLPWYCQCGCGRRRECVHHLLARAPGKKGRRDHWFVVGLAHYCHNRGTKSVHLLGSEAKFQEVHGVDLAAVAVSNLAKWQATRCESESA